MGARFIIRKYRLADKNWYYLYHEVKASLTIVGKQKFYMQLINLLLLNVMW